MRASYKRAPHRPHKFGEKTRRGKKTTPRSILMKRLPILKKVKSSVDKEVFDSLVLAIVSMLDQAISEGFHSHKPIYEAPGNSGRGDTYTPTSNCELCTPPHIPGPSGLY